MKIIYWYAIKTGMTVTTGTLLPDDLAERNCKAMNKTSPDLYHWTVRIPNGSN